MLRTFSGRAASQDEYELTEFVAFLRDCGIRSYGEIGARHGDTFHHILSTLRIRGVAMDLPGGLWGKASSQDSLQLVVADLKNQGLDASFILGDSTTLATRQMFYGRGPYDAILIDGDHTYDGVSADWKNYRKMAPIIAFHDIVGHTQSDRKSGRMVEVPRLWQEIKNSGYKTREFVAPNSSMGIGVVWTER